MSQIQYYLNTSFSVIPNPANDVIEYTINTQEEGYYEIYINSINGFQNKITEWKNSVESGKSTITNIIDLLNYPNGFYWIVLKTPSTVLSQPLIICK